MAYQATPGILQDRIILVSGAGDGIGKVAAQTYASYGATVLLLGRTTSKLEAVYDEIMQAGSPVPGIIPLDFASADAGEMQPLVDVILDRYGMLHGVLHNAAILGDRVPVEHYDMNTWMKVMQVNFTSQCLFTRILMPLLRLAPSASMIFTSSGVGANPRAYWGAYAVSKYALEGFARLLADEMENTSRIKVSILNPGATRTAMRATAYPNEDPATLRTPVDLMPLYLYLMDPAAKGVNGQTFTAEWLDRNVAAAT